MRQRGGRGESQSHLDWLCQAIAATGVEQIAGSVLFTRPRLTGMLRRKVTDTELLNKLLANFDQSVRVGIRADNSTVYALPAEQRQAIYDRLRRAATLHNMKLNVCGCKNLDLASAPCHISGRWNSGNKPKEENTLFPLV